MNTTSTVIKIGQSDLLDFTLSVGITQQSIVRAVKARADYDPRTDYYKPLRDRIKRMHRNDEPLTVLDDLCNHVPDKKKGRYKEAVVVYKRFLRGKTIDWFKPIRRSWTHGDLVVRVNPELGLVINETPHVIKLYFRDEPLKKDKVLGILQLMETTLGAYHPEDTVYSILDVSNNKLLTITNRRHDLMPTLRASALAFVQLYNEL